MKTTYLFNPENDMALACASPYYLPPMNVRRMAADLSPLPYWYASVVDPAILMHDHEQIVWMNSAFPSQFTSKPSVQGVLALPASGSCVSPWGWNPALCHRLQEQANVINLPDGEKMDRLRTLSGRNTAVKLLPSLRLPHTVGESASIATLQEAMDYVANHSKVLFKAPWSGSGRGILPVNGACTKPAQGWIKHILNVQGYVVGEPLYARVIDFAMEFHASDGKLTFQGYSMFDTDGHGAYKGNLLASNASIVQRLTEYVPCQTIDEIRNRLMALLPSYIEGVYEGYFGVDMMICRLPDETYAVHPCVEINWRMNMGLVARFFYDRYVNEQAEGNYFTEFYPEEGTALRLHEERQQQYPLHFKDGKISEGYLSLTPVFSHTLYQAYVIL